MSKQGNIVSELQRKVTRNIYKHRYDIPNDLRVREADADIKMAVRDSQAIKRLEKMAETGIHPANIFISNGMTETQI